ncbi:hypothetical protein NKH33_31025 [Mesorhizobium sp. M1182]|uniref:hypothetical protein n=1 Tax=unclassified Mesorhizobium TaxID=325217 RepID=UPI0033363580
MPSSSLLLVADSEALIKVTTYDFSIFGGIEGKVSSMIADSLVDQKNGGAFYQVRVAADKSTLARDGETYSTIPGIMCSVDIKTQGDSELPFKADQQGASGDHE